MSTSPIYITDRSAWYEQGLPGQLLRRDEVVAPCVDDGAGAELPLRRVSRDAAGRGTATAGGAGVLGGGGGGGRLEPDLHVDVHEVFARHRRRLRAGFGCICPGVRVGGARCISSCAGCCNGHHLG